MKYLSRSKSLLLAIIAGVFLFIPGCDSPNPPPSPTVQQPATTTQPQQEDGGAFASPNITTWPYSMESRIPKELKGETTKDIFQKNYLVILDGSGSMDGNKMVTAKKAVKLWAESVQEDANIGLVAFHNRGWSTLPLATGNRTEFASEVENVVAGGGTPLSGAFSQALDLLSAQGLSQLGYGEYTLVVVTDGAANEEYKLDRWVKYYVENTPITIFTIGFQIGENHSLNKEGITEYRTADNFEELTKGLQEVLAETDVFDATLFESE